jgi:hypothetical protein
MAQMKAAHLELIGEDCETGYDDWEENGEQKTVTCWWGVWRRTESDGECCGM